MSIFSRKSNASLANWRYQPETYSGSVPAALPPTNALLPTERKEMMDKAKEDRNRMATLDAYDEAQRRKSEGGFRNTMAATFKPAFTKLRTYPTPTREAIPSKRDERRFNSRFSLPRYEKLLYASKTCKLLSADMPVLGKIYISEHFLCFRESRLQPKQGRQRLLFAVPLVDIMSIQKGVVASTGDYTTDYRVLAPNELDSVRGEGLWIYTKDSKLHRFTNFWTQQAYDDTYIVLDRTWRRAASQSFSAPREQMAMQQPIAQQTAPTQQINVQPAIQAQEPVQQQRYCMTNSLKSEIVQSSTRSNLRHIASPTPKFSQIIFIDNGKVSAIDRTIYPANARSTGTTSQIVDQSFSQGETKPCPAQVQQEVKGFQRSALKHVEAPAVRGYAPLGHVVGDKRPWKQQQDYQQYGVSPSERPAFPIYYEEVLVTIVTPTQTIPDSLLNEVRSNSKRLRHVEAAARESPVKLGRVVDKSASTTTASTTTSAPMQKEIRDTTSATIEKRVFDLSPQDAWAFGLKSSNQA